MQDITFYDLPLDANLMDDKCFHDAHIWSFDVLCLDCGIYSVHLDLLQKFKMDKSHHVFVYIAQEFKIVFARNDIHLSYRNLILLVMIATLRLKGLADFCCQLISIN